MTRPVIRLVTHDAEIEAAGALIALSFDHLEANHWLIPEPGLRMPAMREFFTVWTEHAAAGAGQVWRTDDGAAVAVWFDRTTTPTEPDEYADRIAKAAGPSTERFTALDEALEAHHPSDPHWHLAFLAVHPDRQNHGLGRALMEHTHAWLDHHGLPAYLEATNPANQRAYHRHQYADMTPATIVLGQPAANTATDTTGATFYRMWRRPLAQP